MPELPEVETVARGLSPLVSGLRVRRVEIFDPKLSFPSDQFPNGWMIHAVTRIGKEVVFHLAATASGEPTRRLGVHLRMTGRLLWTEHSRIADHRHLRARIVLERGNLLFFDPRRFGVIRLLEDENHAFPGGIDPLSDGLDVPTLSALLCGSRQALKPWLMRQDRLIGLGNLYASEICFSARMSPFRAAGNLRLEEVRRLRGVTRRLLARAIRHCGTTFSDFQDGLGQSGRFRRYLNVYDREGKPCRECRTLIRRVLQYGRSTFYCPSCQRHGGKKAHAGK